MGAVPRLSESDPKKVIGARDSCPPPEDQWRSEVRTDVTISADSSRFPRGPRFAAWMSAGGPFMTRRTPFMSASGTMTRYAALEIITLD